MNTLQEATLPHRQCCYLVDGVGVVTCHCLEQSGRMEDVDVPEGSVVFADPRDAIKLALARSEAYLESAEATIAGKNRANHRIMDMRYRLPSFLQNLQRKACSHNTSPV